MAKTSLSFALLAAMALAIPTINAKQDYIMTETKPVATIIEGQLTPDKFVVGSYSKCSEDAKTFQIDALQCHPKSTFRRNAHTREGLLKPFTKYKITFDVTVQVPEGANAFLHFLSRPISDPTDRQDTFRRNIGNTNNVKQSASFVFTTGNAKDYAFQIHSYNRVKAEITNFKLVEYQPDQYIPATPDAEPFTGTIENLPTGSPEFEIQRPQPKNNIVVKATDFGFSPDNKNNALAINKALAECKKLNASVLELAPGSYPCEANAYIDLRDFTDFTLDGKGAKLVGHRTWFTFLNIHKCTRTVVKNLQFDWNWEKDPLASLVEVVAVQEKSFDFKFVHYDNFPRKDMRLAIISAFDPKTRSVGIEGGTTRGFQFIGKVKTDYAWIADNIIRVNEPPRTLKPGQLYRLQHYYYDMNCISMYANEHLTIENVDILSTPGHATLVNGPQHHWQFIDLNIVAPKDDPKRVITCTADHCHIANSKGYFKMIDCEFSLGADDCLNVHDCSGFCRKTGPYSVTTQNARSFGKPAPGTLIELRQGDFSPANFISKIKEVKDIDPKKGVREFIFEDPVPDQLFDGFIMFNSNYDSSNVILKNCFFHDNRARGILLLGRNITVDSCRFRHPEMGAIKIETGYTFNVWSEGYGARNIVVKNCTFDSVNPVDSKADGRARDIYIGVYMKSDPSSERTLYPILSDILFENNTFTDSYGHVAFISSAGNVTFRNNTFKNVTPRKNPLDYRASIYLTHAQNINIVNNTYIESPLVPKPGIFVDNATSKNILFKGNKVVKP